LTFVYWSTVMPPNTPDRKSPRTRPRDCSSPDRVPGGRIRMSYAERAFASTVPTTCSCDARAVPVNTVKPVAATTTPSTSANARPGPAHAVGAPTTPLSPAPPRPHRRMQSPGAHAAGDNAATIRTRPPVRWSDRQPAVHRFAPGSCSASRHVPVPAPAQHQTPPWPEPFPYTEHHQVLLASADPTLPATRSARSAPTPAAVVDGRTPRRGIRLRPAHGPAGTPRYADPTPPGSTRSAPQAPRSAGGWVRPLFHRRGPGARSRARDSSTGSAAFPAILWAVAT